MSRFRLQPTPEQESVLRQHCEQARYVWNLAHEQRLMYRPGRGPTPGRLEQQRQLTEARKAEPWLAAGSSTVQQSALHDLDHAWQHYFDGIHGKPKWRKARRSEGFRIVGKRGFGQGCNWDVRRLSRKVGEVRIPKLGWVRFRWSRAVPDAKSFRVTMDPAGRWHIAFVIWPAPAVAGPGTGEVVGVDRGIAVSAALSTGEMLVCPSLNDAERTRLLRLQRKAARQYVRGTASSKGLDRTYTAMGRLHARQKDRRKDWAEKLSTDIARRFDVIRVEDLKVKNLARSAKGTVGKPGKSVRQKAGINRAIMANGWGILVRRLEEKAPERVEKVPAMYTSQRCSACGHVDRKSRESQAHFRCTACGFSCNADVNAALNIAAGYVVTAREGPIGGPVHREPQLAA